MHRGDPVHRFQVDPGRRARARRAGITAVEILVVIGIMLLLMGMTAPAVMRSIRHGAVNSAANDVQRCWRDARQLALTQTIPPATGDGAKPKHYGLMIVQRAGERSYAALIRDNRDQAAIAAAPASAILRRDPRSAVVDDALNPPVARHFFNRGVQLAVAKAPGDAPAAANQVVVLYAQYGTGLPIAPSEVARGCAPTASAIGLGLPGNPVFNLPASPICAGLLLETLDFATVPGKRGFAVGLAIYPVGAVSFQEQ